MKKKLIYAIFAMVVATVAMVSCKKVTTINQRKPSVLPRLTT